jgi:hypothetical protein
MKSSKAKKNMNKTTSCDIRLDSIDIFGANIKPMNFEGREAVHTHIGVILSIFIMICVGAYATIKLVFLVIKHNPNISTFTEYDVFDK